MVRCGICATHYEGSEQNVAMHRAGGCRSAPASMAAIESIRSMLNTEVTDRPRLEALFNLEAVTDDASISADDGLVDAGRGPHPVQLLRRPARFLEVSHASQS